MYNTKFILKNGQEIYPGYLGKDRRQAIKEKYKGERGFMRCGCKPEAGLFYRISDDLRIYPEHNNYQHDVFCCRYKDGSGNNERQTAYMINEESGEVVAFTSFDPLMFSLDEESPKDQNNMVPESENENIEEIIIEKDENAVKPSEKKEPKLTIEGLIRSINVDSFTEKVLNNQEITSKEKFSVFVFHRMKKVRLARTKRYIGELSLEKDGCKFVYFPFAGVQQTEENGFKRCYLKTRSSDGKVYSSFVFPETVEKAYKKFIKTYGIDPNENTMLAGFQYLKRNNAGRSYKVMGRVHLFQISDLGVYCRSITEVETFNRLQAIVEKNSAVKYWIPPDDESIGAIVEIKGKRKKILILFRNKKDERVAYDKSMYEPLVVDGNTRITEEYLCELADRT